MVSSNSATMERSLLATNTKLPVRRSNSRTSTPTAAASDEVAKWKQKFTEVETRRKSLLSDNEKVRRSLQELEKKYLQARSKNDQFEMDLFEKNESLAKLTIASKGLFREYDALKNQYETETSAMSRALADASTWYKENKILRRRTLLHDADAVDNGDQADPTDTDLKNLNESMQALSKQVSELQTELNASRLSEFETSEQNAQLAQELEEERERNDKLQRELQELTQSHEQIIRVSNIMKRELQGLKEMANSHKASAELLRKEMSEYKTEHIILTQQNTLKMPETAEEGNNYQLLREIEHLKSCLELERVNHQLEVESLLDKLEDKESHSQVEILEERLKLVEAELVHAVRRADECEVNEILQITEVSPAPPPPPPLPQPICLLDHPIVPIRAKRAPKIVPNDNSQLKNGNVASVNDEIINQIKSGLFTLRKAKFEKKIRETPKAVNEMLNILGSLRKTNRNRASLNPSRSYGDVHL